MDRKTLIIILFTVYTATNCSKLSKIENSAFARASAGASSLCPTLTSIIALTKVERCRERQGRITRLEQKIAQLEQKIISLESNGSTNAYTKIFLRSLKINFLKSSFTLALSLKSFDKAKEILKELEKIEDKSKVQKLRRKLKIARDRQKMDSQ